MITHLSVNKVTCVWKPRLLELEQYSTALAKVMGSIPWECMN